MHRRDDVVGLDSALIMNPKVWEASGHMSNFSDPLVECKKCHSRFRLDRLEPDAKGTKAAGMPKCPTCGKQEWTSPQQFNLMFKTFIGPAEEQTNVAYFRPETAQGMFVDFKNVLDTTRKTLPFGIAQIGKAFRNEITPGNFIFRTREFEQMEIEYFIRPPEAASRKSADVTRKNAEADGWEKYFEMWRKEIWNWMTDVLGLDKSHVHELEIPDGERAHYSERTIDFEYDFPFGRKELYGLAYRTDFDLKNHFKEAPYQDKETGEKIYPHVVEPTWGVDRSVLAVLCDSYTEDPVKSPEGDHGVEPRDGHAALRGASRVVLKLPMSLAPYKAAVFPLLANKPQLVELARKIYGDLRKDPAAVGMVAWDERGNIGKRYYAQDEIGTPYCITVDFDSLEKGDVTVRNRDTAKQERVKVSELEAFIREKLSC